MTGQIMWNGDIILLGMWIEMLWYHKHQLDPQLFENETYPHCSRDGRHETEGCKGRNLDGVYSYASGSKGEHDQFNV